MFLIFYFFAGSINFLIADGLKFSHPLHHLGKGPEVNSDHNLILRLAVIN